MPVIVLCGVHEGEGECWTTRVYAMLEGHTECHHAMLSVCSTEVDT